MAVAQANALNDVNQLLALCGIITQVLRDQLMDTEGLTTLNDFVQISDVEVDNMVKRCEARSAASCVSFGMVRIKKFKAIWYWTKKTKRAGQVLDVNTLNAQVLTNFVDKMNLDWEEKSSSDKLYPDKFDPKKVKS